MKQNTARYAPMSTVDYEELHQKLSWLLSTRERTVILPGEAMLGIEAIAAGMASPGRTILNVVTGPYGALFGTWLRRGGSEVVEIASSYDEVIRVEDVERAIASHRPCALSFVQAEAVTGGTNPTRDILAVARRAGVLTMVDAVSAIGAEPVLMDEWGMDFVAVGAQKALGGPNGVSAVGISARGWEFLDSNERAPRVSALSLLDLQHPEVRKVPPTIPTLEVHALLHALKSVEQEGLAQINDRHRCAAAAIRAGVQALGLELWQNVEQGYSPLTTTVRLPHDDSLRFDHAIGIVAPGDGELRNKLLRINHFGANACPESVEEALATLAASRGQSPQDAFVAARTAWEDR